MVRVGAVIAGVFAATLLAASCSSSDAPPPATVTVTQPPAAITPAPAPAPAPTTAVAAESITIPDLVGTNAAIAQDQLEDLGLTEVDLASANSKYSMVILARNWTVVEIEPAPGTVVAADDTVILKVYKD